MLAIVKKSPCGERALQGARCCADQWHKGNLFWEGLDEFLFKRSLQLNHPYLVNVNPCYPQGEYLSKYQGF